MKLKRTWILIADAGRARVLESVEGEKRLTAISDLSFDNDLPPVHELVRDRQPRSFQSAGPGRHPITPKTDVRRAEKQKFAQEIADVLDKRFKDNAFDALVVVAPPQALGDYRDVLSAPLRAATVAEVAKDLTKTPDIEIASHLDLKL